MTLYGIWNETKQKWVRDADSDDYKHWTTMDPDHDGRRTLARMNEIKMLNPKNKDDEFKLKPYG